MLGKATVVGAADGRLRAHEGTSAISLGEAVGKPLSSAPIASNLPTHAISAQAAVKVRNLSTKRVKESWAKLEDEVNVQKLVWDSLVMTTAKEKAPEFSRIKAQFENMIAAHKSGNKAKALGMAQEVTRDYRGKSDLVSVATINACQDVIKQDVLVEKRKMLAERVHVSAVPATLPQTDQEKNQLQDLLLECELADDKLERAVRKALTLPLMSGIQTKDINKPVKERGNDAVDKLGKQPEKVPTYDDVYGTFASVVWTSSRTLDQIAGSKMGAPVSVTGSRMPSDGLGKEVTAKKTLSNPNGSLGAIAKATTSMATSNPMSSDTAAGKVRKMAADCPALAWKKFKDEVEVQKLIWQSVVLMKTPETKKQFMNDTATVQAKINKILDLKSKDPRMALAGVERFLKELPQEGASDDIVNRASRYAAQDILLQHELAPLRLALAERLDVSGVAATLPRTPEQKAEVKELIEKCDLSDKTLGRVVREMMLIEVPLELQDLGDKLLEPKLSGVGPRASGMKKKSTMSSTAERKDSNPLGPGPSAGAKRSNTMGGTVPSAKKSSNAAASSSMAGAASSKPMKPQATKPQAGGGPALRAASRAGDAFEPPSRLLTSI